MRTILDLANQGQYSEIQSQGALLALAANVEL